MSFDKLAPWDALPYFDTPVPVAVNVSNTQEVQLVQANMRRVALIIACVSSNPVMVAPARGFVTTTLGYQLQNTTLPWLIDHEHYGPMVQVEWGCIGTAITGVIVVTEIVLNKWPSQKRKHGYNIQISTGPTKRNGYDLVNPNSWPQPPAQEADYFGPSPGREYGY